MDGWIKLHRSLLDWEWYSDINTMRLFVHLLLKANFSSKKWKGIDIQSGSLITSLSHLHLETGLSIQQIRTSLNRLKSTQEITQYQHSQFTHIQINNYEKYQTSTQDLTSEQQATNKQSISNQQQLKNIRKKECKNEELNTDFVMDDFKEIIKDWLDYKKAKNQSYKTEKSIQAWYNKLLKLSGGSHAKASEIVEQSMANNWAGIFELKKDLPKKEEWNRNGDFNN